MDPFSLLVLPFLSLVVPIATSTPASYEVVQVPTLPDAGKAEAIINTEKPEVSLSRWDGEAQIKVSYLGVEAPAMLGTAGSYIWKAPHASVEAFPIEASPEIVDGGFEFQVVLHQKPPGNVFDFTVEGAEDMDFNYQAPLDEAFKARNVSPKAVSCTATQCFGKDGEVVSERPDNVVGSYAVYAKDKRNHRIGGLNYGMGKMFHIYRPKAISADGSWVWATLKYENNILSVTVPQDFLDSAIYPVIVDPTYGYTSLGASEDATDGCSIFYHAGTFSGATGSTLTTAHWYGRNSAVSETATVWVGLYSTGAVGSKTRRDVVSGSLALTPTKTSYNITGGSYSGLTNGTAYFIETNSDSETGWRTEYDDTGTASSLTYHCNWMSEPPNPSGAAETDEPALNWSFSVYWDYTEPSVYRNFRFLRFGKLILHSGKLIIR